MVFNFKTEAIRRKYLDLLANMTGKENCVDPKIAQGNYELGTDSPTDPFVEPVADNMNTPQVYATVLCSGCPLLEQCRDYAMEAKEPHGIWGGTRPIDRGVQKWRKVK